MSLSAQAYRPRSPAGSLPFKHIPGNKLGLVNPQPQLLDFMLPFSQGRGVAAGDFNGDGWPDLAVADNRGVRLYRNSAGIRFEPVPLDIPRLQQANVLLVALVDLDNDGCLDLFAGTFGDHDFIVAGDCAGFRQARVVELPHLEGLMTQAAAFADIDRDGDLDIISRSLGGEFDLYVNQMQEHHSISFEFRDALGNHFGIGNRITLFYGTDDERHQLREIKAGGGFVSFDPPLAHFGLGQYERVNHIRVDWSDGSASTIDKVLEAGYTYIISRRKEEPDANIP